jgi:response regulator RpfG family c-di-GMP phosphodiesterase
MKTILLIEDKDDIRENTAEMLEMAGYRTETAENGKVGLEKALATKPDLVICDIMMPVMATACYKFLCIIPNFLPCHLSFLPPKPNAPTSEKVWKWELTTT